MGARGLKCRRHFFMAKKASLHQVFKSFLQIVNRENVGEIRGFV